MVFVCGGLSFTSRLGDIYIVFTVIGSLVRVQAAVKYFNIYTIYIAGYRGVYSRLLIYGGYL